MALTATIKHGVVAEHTKPLNLSVPVDTVNYSLLHEFQSGTGNNQANQLWHDTRTLTAGNSENLDLAGSLTNAFGQTVTFAKIKSITIRNRSNTQTLTVGGAASNAWDTWVAAAGHAIKIAPSGLFVLTGPLSGYAVTSGTGDILKIANSSGASAIYDIIIIGTTT